MLLAIVNAVLFLACLLFVGVLVGVVMWDGVSRVIKRLKVAVRDALSWEFMW